MANPRKRLGTSLENRVVARARKLGLVAHRQPGSGVYRDHPNDVALQLPNGDALLVECKVRTTPPSLGQMVLWLEGVKENAAKHHFEGALLVYNTKGSQKPRVLLDLDLFLSLVSQNS